MVLIYDEILLVLENGNNEKNFTLNRFSAVILCHRISNSPLDL